jgi:hypothetical protein
VSATSAKCANPVCQRAAARAGLCDACYLYRRKHKGELRPIEVIMETGRRQLEKELAVPGWGSRMINEVSAQLDQIGPAEQEPYLIPKGQQRIMRAAQR